MSRRKDFPIRAATFLNMLYEKCQSGQPFQVKDMVKMIGISANAPTVAKSTGLVRRLNFHGDTGYTWKWLHDGPPTDSMIKTFVSGLEKYGRTTPAPQATLLDNRTAPVVNNPVYTPGVFQADLINSQAMHQGGGEFPENFATRLEEMERKVSAIYSKLHTPKRSGSLLAGFFTR